jgi:hypothetical protein
MRLTSKPLAVIILVVLFGGILFSSAMGWWQTESSKEAAAFTEGEFAGMPNPADIRGSYTFGDVENNFDVPAETLAKAFGAPPEIDPSAFKAKDLETLYADQEFEIGTASIRLFVALYTGLPYNLAEDVYLPKRAVEMLKSQAKLTNEQIAYLDTHAIAIGPATASNADQTDPEPASESQAEAPAGEETHTEADTTERVIKGKTTFKDLLDWGVSQETIETIIGGPMPNPLTNIKTHCDAQGLYFGDIKVKIQEEIDKVAP